MQKLDGRALKITNYSSNFIKKQFIQQFAAIVAANVRCHFNLMRTDLYTAMNAGLLIDLQRTDRKK